MNKFSFFFKRPKVVVITGAGRACAKEAVLQVLKHYFKINKEILLLGSDKDSEFFLKKSRLPILLVTRAGQYHPDKEFFAGSSADISRAENLAKALPERGYLILNFDDEAVRDLKSNINSSSLTFGFASRADLQATDVLLTHPPSMGTNFKMNYRGNTVPVWLERTFGKEQIYSALAAAALGKILDLNLVEVSEALKLYRSIPGKMQLIPGIKNSWILDDSAGASASFTIEALDVLGKVTLEQVRKIAVLGDVLGIGKHTAENRETVGEKVAKTADLLFVVGNRARFLAEGAVKKGMAEGKIFKFNTAREAGLALQKEIKAKDFILVDGSEEISMMEIVDEIKAGPIV